MPIIQRFETIDCSAITFTGNTLGLSQQTNTNNAGTAGSIGAFTTLDTNLQANPTWPNGTTFSIQENSSSAILDIPLGSTILYAELIWGGNYITRDQDISGLIDNSVNFTTPNGTFSIAPDPITANQPTFVIGLSTRGFYMRSQNVTNLVAATGGGTYSVSDVPGLLDPLIASTNDTNHAGWTLAVIYFNSSLPVRNINLFVGTEGIVNSITTPTIDVFINGFSTPASGPINARILISAQEGDANITGDQVLFGPDLFTLSPLSGPNNLVTNFFGSQINDDTGNLDTTGTFGNRNQDPMTATNIVAGRQSWDITNIDGSSFLNNSQTSAFFRFTTTGDAYMTNAFGLQIDLLPILVPVKTVDKAFAEIGDTLTYVITVTNDSDIDAENVIFTDPIPSGTTFVSGSFIVDGNSIPAADPGSGVNLGTIPANATVVISFNVTINEQPTPATIANQGTFECEFGCIPQICDPVTTNQVTTQVESVDLEAIKTADKQIAIIGDKLTYSVLITNSGTVDATNVMFMDTIPNGATFIPNTFTINGALQLGADPNLGVDLGTIPAGASVIVSYMVTVDFLPCPPALVNQAIITFDFQLSSTSPVQTRTITSNKLIIEVSPTSFKQLSVDETVKIPCLKPDAQQILDTLVDIVIFNTKVIETIKATSLEGQILTGFKLIIEGKLNQKVEYVSDDPQQSVHAAHFIVPFSTFIVLPEEFDPNTTIQIEPFIEDIFTKLIDKRTIFKNITFRLLAKFSNC